MEKQALPIGEVFQKGSVKGPAVFASHVGLARLRQRLEPGATDASGCTVFADAMDFQIADLSVSLRATSNMKVLDAALLDPGIRFQVQAADWLARINSTVLKVASVVRKRI